MTYIRSANQMVTIIKQHRIERGLTQSQLGEIVGMSQKKIATLETLAVTPRIDILLSIMAALDLTMSVQSSNQKKTENNIEIVWD